MKMSMDDTGAPVPLGRVLRNDELSRRQPRKPDYAAEARALALLAGKLTHSPESALQDIARFAQELCRIDSAGIVLVPENDFGNARDIAASGVSLANLRPADAAASPFSVAMVLAAPQLFAEPHRHFTYLSAVEPPIQEMLIVPFSEDGVAGLLWAISLHRDRQFDSEDLRILTDLSHFAAAGCRVLELTEQTQRQRASMRGLEDRLRIKLGAGRFGRWRIDLDDMALTAADQCKSNFGRSPEEPMTVSMLSAAIDADDYARIEQTVRNAIDAGSDYEFEFRVAWGDGSTHWLSVRGMVVYEHYRAVRLEGVSRDITARKSAEQSQQESQRRLQHALDAVGMGMFVWNVVEDRSEPDARLLALMGLDPLQTSLDIRAAMRSRIHPDDRKPHDDALTAAIDPQGPGTLREDLRIVLPSGDERWLAIYGYTEFAGISDHATQMLGMAVDITERKRHEGQLRVAQVRQGYLLALSDALRPLTGAVEIQAAATRVLGEHLRVAHVLYAEVENAPDGDHYVVRQDYSAKGQTTRAGRHAASEIGSSLVAELHAGRTLVVADVANDDRFTERERTVRLAGGVQAYVATPLIKEGRLVAFMTIFASAPREWAEDELVLIEETAERTWAAVERGRAEAALRISEARLAAELHEMKLLQNVSAELVLEDDIDALYGKILEAAKDLLHADTATLQMSADFDGGEQKLLAARGFDGQFEREWVRATSDSICRMALQSRRRVVVPDVEACDFLANTIDLARYLEAGIRAVQTTPLFSRGGKLVGMLSTYWRHPCTPPEQQLGLLDILTRQAADLIDRSCTESALRENEGRFRMLADNMSQLAWTCDRLGEVTWFNQRWYEYTGLTFEQSRGHGWQQVLHPEHAGRIVAGVERARESGQPWEDTFPVRRHDGAYRWFLSRAVPFRDEAGNVVRWLGTNTDITEQREAERSLQEADRRKNEFMAMLAHELRNPLAPVKNALEILKLISVDNKAVESVAAILDRQVGQMTRLVDDLLDVHRISHGKIELRRVRVDLRPIISDTAETIRPICENRRQELTIDIPPYPLYIDGDPTRLAQVVGNLLNNASKFTDRGGRIALVLEKNGTDAQIRIEDNGIGIPQAQLSRIFELFAQVDSSMERSQTGLGIGLTLVRRLAEMHGGHVEARSAGHGKGAEFIVRIPIAGAPAQALQSSTDATPVLSPKKFLIVDDDRDSALSFEQLLTLYGHEVHTAFDGLEAVEAAARRRPDVILLDLGLPKLSGFEAARRIREQKTTPRPVIVAVTGWGQDEDRRTAAQAGFDGHVVKPVDPAALMRLLAELLKNRPSTPPLKLIKGGSGPEN